MVGPVPLRSHDRRGDFAAAKLAPNPAPPDPIVFLVTDLSFKLAYANSAAIRILTYPNEAVEPANAAILVQDRIRFAFGSESYAPDFAASLVFLSGRRHYFCRLFLLDSWRGRKSDSMVGFLLARHPKERIDITEVRGRYRLSPRECETIQYLINGLTTKEVASRMGVSPNTIKQFIRLIMSKMGVTTRLGIVRKILFT
ncbi:MAG TPA: LuxR C-terminal-related transcriptional regulator [Vicinamibacterales bacterium]|nr:LuxR C-terminal-related transcriptional regulator [Vicinamibacterales bacterium]